MKFVAVSLSTVAYGVFSGEKWTMLEVTLRKIVGPNSKPSGRIAYKSKPLI